MIGHFEDSDKTFSDSSDKKVLSPNGSEIKVNQGRKDINVQSKDSIKEIINKKGCRKGGKPLTLTVPFGPSTSY